MATRWRCGSSSGGTYERRLEYQARAGPELRPLTDVFTGYNQHKVWVLRHNGKRVATYRHWQMCIDHINTCVEKFGGRSA